MSDQEKSGRDSVFNRFTSGIKDALFEDEHPRAPDKPSVASIQTKTTPINTGTVSSDDRANAVKVLSERVFNGDTPYTEYRTTFEALLGTVSPDDNRRKAALAVVSKKYSIGGVADAIVAHKNILLQERTVFEQSLSPKQGGVIEGYEKDVHSKEETIQTKLAEIERLKREISGLEEGKKASQEKITEERAKHEHARSVFEVAYQELSRSIESDEMLITSQLPKEA